MDSNEKDLHILAKESVSHFNAKRYYDADVSISYMLALANNDYEYVSDILNQYLHNH